MMHPHLTPIELGAATLDYHLFGWDPYESFSDLAYLEFSGKAVSLLDILNVKWRIEESCRVTRCKRILVDLRRVDLLATGLDVSLLKERTLGKYIRIAVKESSAHSMFQNAENGDVSDDFELLVSDFFSTVPSKGQREDSPNRSAQRFESMERISLEISALQATCYRWQSGNAGHVNGAISISGYYRRGSEGAADGMWIGWQIDHLCEFLRPRSLLVDLSQLDYEWGDDLFVHPVEPPEVDLRVVVHPDRLQSFRGVLGERDLRTDKGIAFAELSAR